MIFLPVTLTLIPIATLVLILSREELRASALFENDMVDGRLYFEDSDCPQRWTQKLELEPELQRPSLELWTDAGTKILGRPSHFGTITLKMVCKAPYPVILLAAFEDGGEVSYGVEVFHLTTSDIYNKSSYNFETQISFKLRIDMDDQLDVYYCQAVHNPCLKSREKLLFLEKSPRVLSFTLRYYSFPSGVSSNSDSDSDSNSKPALNSSSILPLETFLSSSKDQTVDEDESNEHNTYTTDSECEAIFYYEEFWDEAGGRIDLRYRCEFSDGTPGTVQVSRRCSSWARCRFLVAAREKKVKNCWRIYIPGKACLNCTAQKLFLFITEPIIPHCRTLRDGDESGEAYKRAAGEEHNSSEEEDETEEPETEDDLEHVATDESTHNFETEEYEDDEEEEDDEPLSSVSRSVEGTPLYVGFPRPGYEIQRPLIRTDAFDQDNLEESTLVRMNPFPETQLFNTTLQITCDSNSRYTSKIFIFALQFQSEKEKEAQTNLQFVPERSYGASHLNTQTITLHLNRTDISRIFCFAGVQNSYKWINASRTIRVLEYLDFYKPTKCLYEHENDVKLHRPDMSIFSYSRLTGERRVELDEEYPILLLNDGDGSSLTCSADYPIRVLSTFNNTAEYGTFIYQSVQFKTFQNHSSYIFGLHNFKFKPKKESHFYRCQSLENPCLQRSIFYSYVPGPTGQLKFEHVLQNDSDKGSSTIKGRKSQPNSDSSSPVNYPECEVIFLYKELSDFPGYEFRCEFPLQEVGTVKFHYCNGLNDCANLYRNRRQPKICWRKVEIWKKCEDCQESRAGSYRPFVATCETHSYKNGETKVIESTLGSFAAFGLSNQTTGIAPIYFSDEDIDSKATLFLEPFEKYQLFNTILNVTCVSSAYYMSGGDVHIAKFYGGRNELKFIKFGLDVVLQFKVDPEQHEWKITRNIQLGNDSSLTHIFCIGITWLNFRNPVNFSREIHLQGPEKSKIILDAGTFEETLRNTHLHATRNSHMSSVEQEYEFLVNSKNQTLVCHGHGFPTPKIQWVTTAANTPNPIETLVNSSYTISSILLPLIDEGVKGIYICTAMNSPGNATASMRVSLKYPVNKSVVAIVTTSVLILACLSIVMALLWRQIRGLKKVLRDLTPEEVEEFHLGSRTVDPDDPLAEIYALPYDWSLEVPRELIELDETSILGAGQFGLVRSGYIKIRAEEEKKIVAIKQAKAKLRAEEFKSILSEIKVMSHLKQHENVLQILAACTTSIKKCQVLVVMEFCEMGDLHKYLRDRKFIFEDIFDSGSAGYDPVSAITTDKFSTHTLIDFSLGIANGMSYLRQKRVVHGDLAARNVLLTKTLQVKVSDFGCSTHLINYASYTKNQQVVIPWRWFSIEALKEMKLSFKSDVWAFGVLLYEIFTLGELPYSGDELSAEFVQDLANGKRLEQPDYTNDQIYAVMADCWQKEPNERPTFQAIHDRLLLIKNELS